LILANGAARISHFDRAVPLEGLISDITQSRNVDGGQPVVLIKFSKSNEIPSASRGVQKKKAVERKLLQLPFVLKNLII
jgi:hypothetical protein